MLWKIALLSTKKIFFISEREKALEMKIGGLYERFKNLAL